MENVSRRISRIQGHIDPELTSCPYSGTPSTSSSCNSCCSGSGSKNNIAICPYSERSLAMNKFTDSSPLRVVVTGAAGNIAYSLLFMIANGNMFGPRKPVILHLLDIPPMAQALKGIEMELIDCAFPLLKEIVPTTDVKTAFMHVDVAILVGAFPRQKGLERKDLLKKNAAIFIEHGTAINEYANRDVKVVVVGNPANTNCLIAAASAPNIPKQNFTCLTRLDHNRALSQISQKLKVPVQDVNNVVIWGNHSSTQYPDLSYSNISSVGTPSISANARSSINDENWITKDFIATVQQRGAKIIETRKLSSAGSAAHAVVCHMRDWVLGTKKGEIVSMGVYSDGSYGIPKDIIYSFPLTCTEGKWTIVQGLPLSEFSKKQMQVTADELLEEKKEAFAFLSEKN